MEVECLEAEVRSAREQIWENATQEVTPLVTRANHFPNVVRVSVIAAIMFFSTVFPLSLESDRAMIAQVPAEKGAYTWVTFDEGRLLEALRRDLSESNVGRVPQLEVKKSAVVPSIPDQSQKVVKNLPRTVEQKGMAVNVQRNEPPRDEIAIEDVLSLMQVGQKALEKGKTAIEVVP